MIVVSNLSDDHVGCFLQIFPWRVHDFRFRHFATLKFSMSHFSDESSFFCRTLIEFALTSDAHSSTTSCGTLSNVSPRGSRKYTWADDKSTRKLGSAGSSAAQLARFYSARSNAAQKELAEWAEHRFLTSWGDFEETELFLVSWDDLRSGNQAQLVQDHLDHLDRAQLAEIALKDISACSAN